MRLYRGRVPMVAAVFLLLELISGLFLIFKFEDGTKWFPIVLFAIGLIICAICSLFHRSFPYYLAIVSTVSILVFVVCIRNPLIYSFIAPVFFCLSIVPISRRF